MDFSPCPRFNAVFGATGGNYKVHRFSCLDQFLCMAFAQLTGHYG